MKNDVALKSNSLVIRLFLIICLYWFSLYVYIPYTIPFLKDIGTSLALIGLITGAYGFSQMILRPPLGIFADFKGGSKVFILLATGIPCLASLFRLLFLNSNGLLVGNIISGIGAALWICFIKYFVKLFPENLMQKASGLIMAANQIGILTGFLLSIPLYTLGGMTALCFASIIAGATAFILALTLKDKKASEAKTVEQHTLPALFQVYRNKRLWIFSILGILQTGLFSATSQSYTIALAKDLGANNLDIGLINMITMILSVMFSFFAASAWARKRGSHELLPFSFIVMLLYCALTPFVTSIYQIFLLQILCGIYFGMVAPLLIAEASKEIPKDKLTTAMGLYQCGVAVGMSFIPILAGQLIQRYNYVVSYFVLALICFLAALLSFFATRKKQTVA